VNQPAYLFVTQMRPDIARSVAAQQSARPAWRTAMVNASAQLRLGWPHESAGVRHSLVAIAYPVGTVY
jgi:hypothetical protein